MAPTAAFAAPGAAAETAGTSATVIDATGAET